MSKYGLEDFVEHIYRKSCDKCVKSVTAPTICTCDPHDYVDGLGRSMCGCPTTTGGVSHSIECINTRRQPTPKVRTCSWTIIS